jgi:hypothetical protein
LTVGSGDACERRAAIGGDRCAGDVDGVGVAASRIVVGHENLVGIIRISHGKGLRLRNVGRGLSAGDQVDIRTAVRQGNQQFFNEVADRTQSGSRIARNARHLAASNHDRSGAEIFLLVNAQLVNFGTVKSNRNQWVRGTGDNFAFLHRLYDALSSSGKGARAQQRQKDANQNQAQTD